ncbi:hypothetical protein B8A10_11625 [Staphylococcus aureus]|nr:hypothetical protein B8A10_11625 [Staphylococcus aureus]
MHREWDRNDIFTKLICLPQLALPVEFLYEILCVGAPSPTRIACLNWGSNFSMLGPCQYNIVEPRTL